MLKAIIAPYLPYLYGVAALGAVALGLYAYNSIYDRGYESAAAVYEQQALDLKAANDLAIEKAKEVLNAEIITLNLEKERLEDDVSRLNAEAAQDPDGATGGIKRGGVQRLNAVR